jgi:2',3'-cyclic-nucleotide 2'-phosphodiesterase (5'-nucleotidase family)
MAAILGPVRARVDRELDEVVGEAGGVFFPTGPDRDTPLHQLLCAAIAAALRTNGCPVDAVIHGTLNERAGLSPGPIRERDLYELVPYENTLGVVTLTPDQFDAILRESLTASSTKGTGGRRLWGLHAAWNGTNFTWKTPEGQPWPGTNLVRVAFNSYDLAGAGARLPVLARLAADPATRTRWVPIQTRDALRDYFRANRPVRPVVTPWVTGRP